MSLYAAAIRIAEIHKTRVPNYAAKICIECDKPILPNEVVRMSLRNRSWEWSHCDCNNPKQPLTEDWGIAL